MQKKKKQFTKYYRFRIESFQQVSLIQALCQKYNVLAHFFRWQPKKNTHLCCWTHNVVRRWTNASFAYIQRNVRRWQTAKHDLRASKADFNLLFFCQSVWRIRNFLSFLWFQNEQRSFAAFFPNRFDYGKIYALYNITIVFTISMQCILLCREIKRVYYFICNCAFSERNWFHSSDSAYWAPLFVHKKIAIISNVNACRKWEKGFTFETNKKKQVWLWIKLESLTSILTPNKKKKKTKHDPFIGKSYYSYCNI